MSDRKFKIVSVGWNCEVFIQRTLDSVARQNNPNWEIGIIYDPSGDNGPNIIQAWCDEDPERRHHRINAEQMYAVRNQNEAIYELLQPEDDDVIVFLDLDGDQLAHEGVLDILDHWYSEPNVLLTYGQYRPVPDMGDYVGARPWPEEVVSNRSYRKYILTQGPCFNHLRTVKAEIFKAIPADQFKWANGNWYKGATDYVTMIPALELVDGRYKFIEEVILDYNHANPFADNKVRYDERHSGQDAAVDVCMRPRLPRYERNPMDRPERLVPTPQVYGRDAPGSNVIYLSGEQRREIIRNYARFYRVPTFVETGTNDGGTPLFLKDEFDQLFTIELSRDLWKAAQHRLAPYRNIHCLQGDSTQVLQEVLREFNGPALFWLDGHYSGGVTARGALDTPVKQELQILFGDGRPHVILVDDARIFEGGPEHFDEPHYHDYPSIEWVEQVAAENDYFFLLEDDIMRLTPKVTHDSPH